MATIFRTVFGQRKNKKLKIAGFERGDRNLRMYNFEKILNAFEKAGIEFLNNEKDVGVIELSKK
jgi:hypothetical protein